MAGFPKSARILRSREFRKVYEQGVKFSGPLFAAFCLRAPGGGARFGFTTPRALGSAVVRNRVKRRLREAVRLRRRLLETDWLIVINPRRRCLDAPFSDLQREVDRLFRRCADWSSASSGPTN